MSTFRIVAGLLVAFILLAGGVVLAQDAPVTRVTGASAKTCDTKFG